MFAIYDKKTNKIMSKFSGEEKNIENVYNLEKFGYVSTVGIELDGNPNEYRIINGNIKRRDVNEIIAEIEDRNPLLKQIKLLQQENALLYSAIAELSILIGGKS